MKGELFEKLMRGREWFHGLTIPPGMWTVIRVDGRGFTKLADRLDLARPFDNRFSTAMVIAAEALVVEFNAVYAFTESDEISILLPPGLDLFGRSVEKLVSVSAGITSSVFTHSIAAWIVGGTGYHPHFDSRLWVGATVDDVVDYFSWRQADAARCAINGWAYWTLRKNGHTAAEATAHLNKLDTAAKNELLYDYGVNFNDTPQWQRHGIGVYWSSAFRGRAERRTVSTDREIPRGDEYRDMIRLFAEQATAKPVADP